MPILILYTMLTMDLLMYLFHKPHIESLMCTYCTYKEKTIKHGFAIIQQISILKIHSVKCFLIQILKCHQILIWIIVH